MQVQTKYGMLQSVQSQGGYALFKGVPYAAPPVGELRWRPSIDPQPWQGVRVCDTWGAACPQELSHGDPNSAYGKEFYSGPDYPPLMDEDCLYLNIWTPAKTGEEKLPVMMWMHGGGVQSGYSHEIEFDGDAFCRRGVILVTINYRLNILGYFAHPELSAESPHGASGNYGLHDQLQALRWIHDCIAAFGGDPDNVTIFGQSGGGRSTQALACSPLAKGLVKHAIVQSAGGVTTAFGRMPREQMEQRGLEFMRFAGCENLAALRAIPAAELVQKLHDFGASAQSMEQRMARGFNISTDGYALPLSMEDTLLEGRQLDLDYMLGSVTLDDRMSSMMASHRGWATLQARTGLKAPYLYRFTRQLPEDDPADERPLKGAFHSSELWYTFGTLGRCWRPMTQADYALSEVMTDAWANFAKTGDPNGGKVPTWTPYTPDNKLLMRFDIEGMGMTDFDPDGSVQAAEDALLRG